MFEGVVDIDWRDPAWSISAALTITIMPLTYSIADGLSAGIISYLLVKAAAGEGDEIRPGQWLLASVLIVYFYIQTSGMLL